MTKEEIIAKAKIIFVRPFSGKEMEHPENYKYINDVIKETDNFLKNRPHLYVGSDNPDFTYNNINAHHYTTAYWYSIFEQIANYLNIPYNVNDYDLKKNIVNDEDYSYLIPKFKYIYKVTANKFTSKIYNDKKYVEYIPFSSIIEGGYDVLVSDKDVFNSDLINGVNTPYHRLFTYTHQCVMIENLSIRTGRTLCINCDSHATPWIPLLANYFDKIVVLDNRLEGCHLDFMYKNINFTDSLIVVSYNSLGISKIMNYNF